MPLRKSLATLVNEDSFASAQPSAARWTYSGQEARMVRQMVIGAPVQTPWPGTQTRSRGGDGGE